MSSSCAHVVVLTLRDFSTFLSLLSIFSLIILSFLLAINFIFQVRTPANEDLGTPAVYDPLTGYEPNDYHITEAYVEYTQGSSGEQRIPDDFDYDNVTIGKTLLNACRRRADHSEEKGLSSCLSSSVSHDRTGRPVVCSTFDSQGSSVQEIQRHNSESEQVRILLERQRAQVMSPRSTTSRRSLNRTSRNPQARMGPRMTSSTMTSPSAIRSLHHCSPRSEETMRAVDELITLKTKSCCPVSRRPSVIVER